MEMGWLTDPDELIQTVDCLICRVRIFEKTVGLKLAAKLRQIASETKLSLVKTPTTENRSDTLVWQLFQVAPGQSEVVELLLS